MVFVIGISSIGTYCIMLPKQFSTEDSYVVLCMSASCYLRLR